MATVDDFTGRGCPFCGAVDSLEADEQRGEVACVECARVVAMGLEESLATRFDKDATYADADRHGGGPQHAGDELQLLAQAEGSHGLSRHAAAALAAGFVANRNGPSAGAAAADVRTEAGREAKYARTQLHPKMTRMIDNLCRISRRGGGHSGGDANAVKSKALSIAKTYVGYRRESGKKVESQAEVAAACFQIAAELNGEPVPLAELRVLDPSLRNVEAARKDVIADTAMDKTEATLRQTMPLQLMRYYVRLLHVQMLCYERPCECLLQALRDAARRHTTLIQLVEAEMVLAAVLLARTERTITWAGKPTYDPALEPSPENAYASFAANAHLNVARVQQVMKTVRSALQDVTLQFDKLMAATGPGKSERPAEASVKTEAAGTAHAGTPVGVKRQRSPEQ